MSLGSAHGVEVDFDGNCMSGWRFGRARRRVAVSERFDGGTPAEPPKGRRYSLAAVGSFAGALSEEISASQDVPGGSRKITIRTKLETQRTASALSEISAELRFDFDLAVPATWTVCLAEPASVVEANAQNLNISLDRTAVSILSRITRGGIRLQPASASQPYLAWSIDFESGKTEVTIGVSVRAWENISDHVVICRPDQMREAAIALAAIPDRRFVPLMVLEPPPMSQSDLLEIFRDFRATIDKTLGQAGALGLAEFRHKSEHEQRQFLEAWAARRDQQRQMQPYRSWAKRNTMLRKALFDFRIKKAVCLFDPAPHDLALTNIEYALMDAQNADRPTIPNLLDGVERIVLQSSAQICRDRTLSASRFDQLFDECHKVFGETHSSSTPIEVDDDDPAGIILGLRKARGGGRRLRVVAATAASAKPSVRAFGTASDAHVVAIEVQDDAQSLIAALFSAELGTTLVTIPKPDLGKTEAIVRGLQGAVVEWAQQAQKGDPAPPTTSEEEDRFSGAISAAFRKFIFGDRRPELLGQLVDEVSSQVPSELVKMVGDSALTVFGAGLPYSFVKQGDIDWSNKPIGHVISDPDLIVMSELHNVGAIDPIVAFNVIIDPGFFRYSETAAVAEALKARPAKSLILRKDARIATMLPIMIGELPLDFIFFNTHGTDQAIMLDAYPLYNYLITQWFQFDQRPLIFNNSCMSWTGVGRDFVRVGARGYVGTLWSVGANAAAELAESSMARMIDHGEPICAAIRRTEVDALTSRAYIFVGTARASFSIDPEEDLVDDPVRLVAVMQNYLRLLYTARRDLTPGEPNAFTAYLYAELKALREGLIARNEPHLNGIILDSVLAESELLNDKNDTFNPGLDYRMSLVEKGDRLLAQATLGEEERNERAARLLFFRAEINRLARRLVQADADAKACIELEKKLARPRHSAQQVRIQIAIDAHRIDQALELAQQTMSPHQDGSPNSDREYELMTLGRLCQIMKRNFSRLDEAVDLAKKGIALAESLEDLGEQACFEHDLAQIYRLQQKPEAALAAAQRALAMARRVSHAIGELGAYGTIGQCYLDLNDMSNARTHAQLGLQRARELDEPRRVGAFLSDLAQIEERSGNISQSLSYWLEAIAVDARAGDILMWQGCVSAAFGTCLAAQDTEQCARLVCNLIASVQETSVEFTRQLISGFLASLPQLYESWPSTSRGLLFARVMEIGQSTISNFNDGSPEQSFARLLFSACFVFFLVEVGKRDDAIRMASDVDQAIDAGGRLLEDYKRAMR